MATTGSEWDFCKSIAVHLAERELASESVSSEEKIELVRKRDWKST